MWRQDPQDPQGALCVVVYFDVAVFTGVWRQEPPDPQSVLCTVMLQCSPECGGKTRKVHCVLYCYCDVAVFTGVWWQDPQGALCIVLLL